MDAYQEGATAVDVVAKTRELKRRHRAPLVMPEDYRRKTYRRKRRVREEDGISSAGSEIEDEDEDGDNVEEDSELEGSEQDGSEEHHKMELVALVKTFICDTTGREAYENQQFSFHDFMEYLKTMEGRSPRKGGREYMKQLIENFNDAFLLNGDRVCLGKVFPKEAEPELFKSSIWTIVDNFILETTLKKPYDMQHFCLCDLQNWFANKTNIADEVYPFKNV